MKAPGGDKAAMKTHTKVTVTVSTLDFPPRSAGG